jgi:hypothetical protein
MSTNQEIEIPVDATDAQPERKENKSHKKDRRRGKKSREKREHEEELDREEEAFQQALELAEDDVSDLSSGSGSEYESDEDSVVDLCDDRLYQVLSAVLETESGRNVAEILSKMQKDLHVLTTSVNQLIQLSLAAQQNADSDAD